MGLRGTAGTHHLDGGHTELNAPECTAEGAESVFPRGEFGPREEAEQLEATRAAILVQEAKQKYERLGRLVQVLVQAR